MASFPAVSLAEWRAHVEADLHGASFESALCTTLPEGVSIAPVYADAPPVVVPGMPGQFLLTSVEGEACWVDATAADPGPSQCCIVNGGLPTWFKTEQSFALNADALAAEFVGHAQRLVAEFPHGRAALISTLGPHEQGADGADELAISLATGAAAYRKLLDAHVPRSRVAQLLGVQMAVGRDTFVELCKLRALRVCWAKLTAAFQLESAPLFVHAVSSSRTLTTRAPWVNALRNTTQVFAAVVGGANVITPTAFDQDFEIPSELGQRLARNTGLILRNESFLGQVIDAAAGSYFFDQLTDALAREAWKRFQRIEGAGGIVAAAPQLEAHISATRQDRERKLSQRRLPVVGVTDFANLEETLPGAPRVASTTGTRDAEGFEQLRRRAEAKASAPVVSLVTLGSVAPTRARIAFAVNAFAAGGMRARDAAEVNEATVACICGTDAVYEKEAVRCAQALKAQGYQRVLLAGRPASNQTELEGAGVDDFLFLGCDVMAVMNKVLDVYP
jgi:methylmalonyl-CoA mutase